MLAPKVMRPKAEPVTPASARGPGKAELPAAARTVADGGSRPATTRSLSWASVKAPKPAALGKQPATKVGRIDDPLEQEALHIARRVMLRPDPPANASDRIIGQTQAPAHPVATIPSQGRHLDENTRGFFESRFGYDFSQVRIHADHRAAVSAAALGADAYAIGKDIVFGRGLYQPDSPAGRRLLAHELVHVMQQSGGFVGHDYRANAGPLQIQRQVPSQPEHDRQAAGDEQVSKGTSFFIEWQHLPSLNEVLVNMVAEGFLDEAAARASKYISVRRPGARAAWSIVHPQYGEIAEFQITVHTVNGRRFGAAIGSSIMPGKPGQIAAAGSIGATPQPGDGGLQKSPPSASVTGPNGQSGPIASQQSSTPDADGAAQQEPKQDIDALLGDNPHWRNLSKEDRKILEDLAKESPEELSKNYAVNAVTTDVKLIVALKLASGWPGEVLEAAKAAFSDPTFVIMLIVTLGIYVGLWLVPEPSGTTKAFAGLLTAFMLGMFAWDDIYGLAKAWMELEAKCQATHSTAELKAAGDEFSRKIGSVGFDILMFIATFALGKAIGPRLAKIGAARGVSVAETGVRGAEANVEAAKAKPGSGVPGGATPESAKLLDSAKAGAKGTTATAILDALSDLLPEQGKRGLRGLRNKTLSSDSVLRQLEQMGRSRDIGKHLSDLGETAETRQTAAADIAKANAELAKAKLQLARAKLIESRTIADPALRKTIQQQQYAALSEMLKQIGALDGTDLGDALRQRDVGKVISELRRLITDITKPQVSASQGAIGEALLRSTLRAKYAGRPGIRFVDNVAIVRRIAGYRTIAEWRAAAETRIRTEQSNIKPEELQRRLSREAGGLREKNGVLYRSVTDLDTLVTDISTGKARPIEVAEAKAGGDNSTKAMGQLSSGMDALQGLQSGADPDIRVFAGGAGSTALGADLTSTFDLSRLGNTQRTTMGPQGRQFTQQFELTADEFRELAESLLKNLPPDKPQTIPPMALPYDKRPEAAVAPRP